MSHRCSSKTSTSVIQRKVVSEQLEKQTVSDGDAGVWLRSVPSSQRSLELSQPGHTRREMTRSGTLRIVSRVARASTHSRPKVATSGARRLAPREMPCHAMCLLGPWPDRTPSVKVLPFSAGLPKHPVCIATLDRVLAGMPILMISSRRSSI